MRSTTAMPSRYAAALLSSINWGTDVDGASVVLTATGLSSNYDAFVVVFDQPTLSPRWSRMLKGTSNLFHEACVIAPSLAASRRDAQWPISMALIGVARNVPWLAQVSRSCCRRLLLGNLCSGPLRVNHSCQSPPASSSIHCTRDGMRRCG
jgi:hypothetical protein